jgi:ubiquinone/menaquinone biosynthesis C-methylase UbiE
LAVLRLTTSSKRVSHLGALHAGDGRVIAAGPTIFLKHWVEIEPERLARYDAMFRWSPAAEAFYAPAAISTGHVVADFGCGPGYAALELARRVGPAGHVHALDINVDFIARTRANAEAEGLSDRITAHLLEDGRLPLPDAILDRVITRNTIIYVHDPIATFREFRRCLRPGGLAHAIESDWSLTAVEPVSTVEWRDLVRAAAWAWRTPEIGRQLYGIACRAGFSTVSLEVVTKPDTDGRLLGMIQTVADYARESGEMEGARIDALLQAVQRGLEDKTYLAVAPQFVITAVT